MKYNEIIGIVERDGWYFVRQKGSHLQFRHPTKKGTVTIPSKGNRDIPAKTKHTIFKQAGLRP
jgi:predicted RNA binding protein YcfA (HicA-like mRNA interferase family)